MIKVLVSSYIDSSFVGEVEASVRPKNKDVIQVGETNYRVNKVLQPDLYDTVNDVLKVRVRATQVA